MGSRTPQLPYVIIELIDLFLGNFAGEIQFAAFFELKLFKGYVGRQVFRSGLPAV